MRVEIYGCIWNREYFPVCNLILPICSIIYVRLYLLYTLTHHNVVLQSNIWHFKHEDKSRAKQQLCERRDKNENDLFAIRAEDMVSYTAPMADKIGPNGCNVEDTSYDGTVIESLMLDGLGQLTDGIVGSEIEILESDRVTNWVGWRDRKNIELLFEFQAVRKFANCTIHMANLPDLRIQVCDHLK